MYSMSYTVKLPVGPGLMRHKLKDETKSLIASIVLSLEYKSSVERFNHLIGDEQALLAQCEKFLTATKLTYESGIEEIQERIQSDIALYSITGPLIYSRSRNPLSAAFSEGNIMILSDGNMCYPNIIVHDTMTLRIRDMAWEVDERQRRYSHSVADDIPANVLFSI